MMTSKRFLHRSRSQAGTATVEAAIVSLAFFVTLLGVIEIGRLMHTQQTLTDAVREGARLGVAPISQTDTLATTAEIQAEVERFLATARVTGASVTVESPVVLASGDEMTRVTVTAPYQVVTLSLFSETTIQLSASSLMRNEISP